MRIKQRYECVSGGKSKLSAQLWGGNLEGLLGLMRKLGNISEATRGGVAFERVHCSADAAPCLRVGG